MRAFQTGDASWFFVGPDRGRDAAEQLGQDLWVLSDPNKVPHLTAHVAARAARAAEAAGPAGFGSADLVTCVLDGIHDVATAGRAAGAPALAPEIGVLCTCIADALAECARPEPAAGYLLRLTAALDALALQTGGGNRFLALASSIAVSIDAPFACAQAGFFELHDVALRRLFTADVGDSDLRSRVDTFFDAQLALERARSAVAHRNGQGARELLEAARVAFLAVGLRVEAAGCDRRLALEARLAGDLDTAWDQLTSARATLGEFGAAREVALCHLQAGLVLLDRDDPAMALTEAETALGMFSDQHASYELEICAEVCSRAAERLGDLARALVMARFAHMLCESRTSEDRTWERLMTPP